MLLRTEYRVLTARVVGVEQLEDAVVGLVAVACERHIVLLVNGLKFGVEAANYIVREAIRLNLCPILHLIRGDILGVDSLVERCPSVGARSTDCRHQLVVLVGDCILRSLLRNAVNLSVDLLALGGVLGVAIELEENLDLLEQRSLSSVVRCTELLRALEH